MGKLELNLLLSVAIVLVVNFLGQYVYTQIDMTEEKRFTLTEPTRNELSKIDDVVTVEVLLEGEFPAGFKRLQNAVRDMFRQFQRISPYIEVNFVDPNAGTVEEVNRIRQELGKDGIRPVNLRVSDGTEMKEKLIYPYAVFKKGTKRFPINFLDNNVGFDQEQNLNNSISLLEYRFIDAIAKLRRPLRTNILFTQGHGELSEEQLSSFNTALIKKGYLTDAVPLDSTIKISEEAELLVIANPTRPFSDRDKFVIDQYIMNGGRVLWFVDKLLANMDSLSYQREFLPRENDLNIDDMLFKYGVRVNSELVVDLECTRIPQVIGSQGGKPQIELFPWFYHPLAAPKGIHPIVKNLDRINLTFPNAIDTVKTKTPIRKEVLLQSSDYSRVQVFPTKVNFDIMRYKPDPDKFNDPNQNLAVLLEGIFPSAFENNVSAEMLTTFRQLGIEFKEASDNTKMIVVSDGSLVKNLVDPRNGNAQPLGFNKWEKFTFNGNQDFLMNCVEYLLDDAGILEARAKDVKLRLLDKVKTENERSQWQLINLLVPVVFLILFGLGFKLYRDRKYAV